MVVGTFERPGFHAECDTSSCTWRRRTSTRTAGAGARALPDAASMSSAVWPCHVRKSAAGEDTPAPWGQATAEAEEPSAMVKAVRDGARSVFSVTRKAVAS